MSNFPQCREIANECLKLIDSTNSSGSIITETIAAIIKIMISGSLNCNKNFTINGVFFFSSKTFVSTYVLSKYSEILFSISLSEYFVSFSVFNIWSFIGKNIGSSVAFL